MGLPHVNRIVWKGNGEGKGRVYRFWGGHRKVKYMKALVGGAGEVGYISFGKALEKWST